MKKETFDRKEHVYKNDAFVELVREAVRFFNKTPVHSLPPPAKFRGTGVYAIYYTGTHQHYAKYGELNREAYNHPIYVGKAVPRGWRQARVSSNETKPSTELYDRIHEHSHSLELVGLQLKEFSCRCVILEGDGSDMIGTLEAALIKAHKPLWNSTVDGFGNHDPGSGRYGQAKSDWDVLHPGREWAARCLGPANSIDRIVAAIAKHLDELGK